MMEPGERTAGNSALNSSSEINELIKNFSWSATSLGNSDRWPISLRININNVLASSFPMILMWGRDSVCIYNEAFSKSLVSKRKHPAIGMKGMDVWEDLWEFVGPITDAVMTSGKSQTINNKLTRSYDNGVPVNKPFTFSFNPAFTDDAQTGGVLITCIDTSSLTESQNGSSRHADNEAERKLLRIYEAITAATPDLVYVFDLQYRFTYVNKALLTMWGKTWDNAVGKGLRENGYEEWHAQMHEREIDHIVATKQSVRGEVSFPHAVFGRRVYDYILVPVLDENGQVESVAGTTRDITDLKYAELQLKEREARLKSIFEQAPIAIGLLEGREMVIREGNDLVFQLWNKPRSVTGSRLEDALPELRDQPFLGILQNVFDTGKPFFGNSFLARLEYEGATRDVYFDFAYTPVRDSHDKITSILIVATDVTERVLAKKAIEESEQKLQAIIAAAPVAIGVFRGRDLVIENPNQTFIDIVGKGPDIVGRPLSRVMPELLTEGQPFLKILDDVYTTGVPFLSPASLVKIVRNGVLNDNYYNISYMPLRDGNGDVCAILDVAVDVTELVNAQHKIQEKEASLQTAIELAELGTWEFDLVSHRIKLSKRHAQIFGIETLEIDFNLWLSFISDEYRQDAEAKFKALLQSDEGHLDAEYEIVNSSTGTRHIIHVIGQRSADQKGNYTHIRGTTQDVTAQREIELALQSEVHLRTQELAAANEELQAANEELSATNEELSESTQQLLRTNDQLQQFAYAASHDLQEPLRKIQTFSDRLLRMSEVPDAATKWVDKIDSSASRMSTLIKNLLEYSSLRKAEETYNTFTLNDVVADVLKDFDHLVEEKGAHIVIGDLPTIHGSQLQMRQLFGNLISNALKFVSQDARPTIEIKANTKDNEFVKNHIHNPKQETYHHITVSDNGIGFDSQYAEQIFEIFKRLHMRTEYRGSGIGLALCKQIVVNHKGYIYAESSLGKGATFHILFPKGK